MWCVLCHLGSGGIGLAKFLNLDMCGMHAISLQYGRTGGFAFRPLPVTAASLLVSAASLAVRRISRDLDVSSRHWCVWGRHNSLMQPGGAGGSIIHPLPPKPAASPPMPNNREVFHTSTRVILPICQCITWPFPLIRAPATMQWMSDSDCSPCH